MNGVNKVTLLGNLGRDPELTYSASGTPVCNFSVATSVSWKDRDSGEKVEKTEWHRIVSFRRLAEVCDNYLSKGSKVYIEGRLQTRSYEKNNEQRYITEVILRELNILSSSKTDHSSGDNISAPLPDDDEIPF